jgi:hypothetical protein
MELPEVDELIGKKNVILDATSLSSLMGCGRYYDLRMNHRFVSSRGKSNSLEVGLLIHKVFEVFYKHQINGFPRSTCISNALTMGQLFITGCPYCANHTGDEPPACKHEPEEYPGMQNTPEKSEKWTVGWKFALDTCEQYFAHYKNDAFIPLAAETVRGEILYEDDEIRILWKAKMDLIIDTNQIGIISMDHKSFKQRRDKTTLSNQFMGQCCLLKSRNVLVNKIGLQTTLKIEERLTREMVSFSANRLEEWKATTLPYYAYKFIEYKETGYWPPNYAHCDNMFGACMFKDVCEADTNMREEVLRLNFNLAPKWDPTNKEDE